MFNYPNYNLNPQQQRLMQLEQQQMQQNFNAQQQKGFTIIPVTNQQEAYAAQIDIMNGTPSFFYNQKAGEIYLKQINQTGNADFIKFVKSECPISNENMSDNINTYKKDFEGLNDKLDGLYKLLAEKGGKNAK